MATTSIVSPGPVTNEETEGGGHDHGQPRVGGETGVGIRGPGLPQIIKR